MHHLIVLTAMTATAGLFGGGARTSCATGPCGTPAFYSVPAPMYPTAPQAAPVAQAPAAPAAQYHPTPYGQAPTAHGFAPTLAPTAPMAYPSYYYAPQPTAPFMASCAGGRCR